MAMLCAAILWSLPLRAQGPAAGATVESVSVAVAGGTAIGGRYRDAGRGAPGVLLFPMCGPSGADGWRPVAERLHAAGVSSLMVDEPGYGPNGAREARADAALAYLRSRLGGRVPIALTGGSCGVALALSTASRHSGTVGAVVLVSGPYGGELLEYVRTTPTLAVFSGASAAEPPSPEWARALKQASVHPASRVEIWTPRAHGTDYFAVNPAFVGQVTEWLVERLTATPRR
jgi:pimeloyl-ACP methyl ester carboxylesterase